MPTKVIEMPVDKAELSDLELKGRYGGLVKAVVDIEKKIMMAGVTMLLMLRNFFWRTGLNRKIFGELIFIFMKQKMNGSNTIRLLTYDLRKAMILEE